MQLAKLTGWKVKQLWSGKTRFKEKKLSNKIIWSTWIKTEKINKEK